jgi:hypothetical protein
VIIYKFTPGKKSRPQKIRQKLISVASQENKSQIATLATDSAIPDLTMGYFQYQQTHKDIENYLLVGLQTL